jgi:hypothetical protein
VFSLVCCQFCRLLLIQTCHKFLQTQQLEQENLDLKLEIYHLKQREHSFVQEGEAELSRIYAENGNLSHILEIKRAESDDRAFQLVQAHHLIENLQADLALYQSQGLVNNHFKEALFQCRIERDQTKQLATVLEQQLAVLREREQEHCTRFSELNHFADEARTTAEKYMKDKQDAIAKLTAEAAALELRLRGEFEQQLKSVRLEKNQSEQLQLRIEQLEHVLSSKTAVEEALSERDSVLSQQNHQLQKAAQDIRGLHNIL